MDKIVSLLDLEKLKDDITSVNAATKEHINKIGSPTISTAGAILSGLTGNIGGMAKHATKAAIKESAIGPAGLNQLAARNAIPSEIQISPELARFLVDDHLVHEAKAKVVKNMDKRWAKDAMVVGNVAFMGITAYFGVTPTSFGGLLTNSGLPRAAYSRIAHGLELKKEYERLMGERDQIACSILGHYMVTESESGEFNLKRGDWQWLKKKPESLFDGNFTVKVVTAIAGDAIQLAMDPTKDVLAISPVGVDPKMDLTHLPELPTITRGRDATS